MRELGEELRDITPLKFAGHQRLPPGSRLLTDLNTPRLTGYPQRFVVVRVWCVYGNQRT